MKCNQLLLLTPSRCCSQFWEKQVQENLEDPLTCLLVCRYGDFESTCQKLGGQLPTLINPSNKTELQAINDKYFSQYRFLITESAKKCGVGMLNFWIQLGEGIDLPKEDRDYHISDSKLKHNLRVEGAKKVRLGNTVSTTF